MGGQKKFELMKNFKLDLNITILKPIVGLGIVDFRELYQYIQELPYGRNASRFHPELVLTEKKGTCSSKHAFLKKVALEHSENDIELILGIYKMNQKNTPGIGNVLFENQLDYIPEAHCYLKFENNRIDFTNPQSDFTKIEKDILIERSIQPEDVAEFKVKYHQTFLQDWIKKESLTIKFDEVWKIREKCIHSLEGK